MSELVIVGAGGFGREVYEWAQASLVLPSAGAHRIKGFLSNRPADLDGFDLDAAVLGDPAEYVFSPEERVLFAIGAVEVKRQMIDGLRQRGAQFAQLIHPSAVVARSARIGVGAIICPFATVSANAVVGDHAMVNLYASVAHDARLGAYSVLSPYATLNGSAVVEDEVFVGSHATVTPKVRVGRGAKISANVAVTSKVDAGSLVFAKAVRQRQVYPSAPA